MVLFTFEHIYPVVELDTTAQYYRTGFESQPFTCCGTLGKPLHFSEPYLYLHIADAQ